MSNEGNKKLKSFIIIMKNGEFIKITVKSLFYNRGLVGRACFTLALMGFEVIING